MKNKSLMKFLASFFQLFKAKIEKYSIDNNTVYGTVGWENEEDKQTFSWNFENEDSKLITTILLCDFLNSKHLVNGDRFIISEEDLVAQLTDANWLEEEARKAINQLCSIEVDMIDDGEKTDSFFIHF